MTTASPVPDAPRDVETYQLFVIKGRINAVDQEGGVRRLHHVLKALGFTDPGDGSLWLDRPQFQEMDEAVIREIGEVQVYIDSAEGASL